MDEKYAWRALGNREDGQANSAQPSKVAVIEGVVGVVLIIIGFLAITLIAVGMRAVPLIICAYGIPSGPRDVVSLLEIGKIDRRKCLMRLDLPAISFVKLGGYSLPI